MKRRARRKSKRSPKTLIILAVTFFITVGLLFNAVAAFIRSRKFQKEYDELATTIEQKQEEIKALEDKLNMLESGEGLELEARARLNLQRPDEQVVIIVDKGSDNQDKKDNEERSFWNRIINWFTNE